MTIARRTLAKTDDLMDTGAKAAKDAQSVTDDVMDITLDDEPADPFAGDDAEDAADAARGVVAEAVEEDEIEDEPDADADTVVLRFKGPARTYSLPGVKEFNKGQARSVPRDKMRGLLATGMFERATKEALNETVQEQTKDERKVTNFQVGNFKTKPEALAWAKSYFGVDLDGAVSLRQLNDQTLSLVRAAKRMRDQEGIEFVE